LGKGATLEHVRREIRIGETFSVADFERAFLSFGQMYQTRPSQVLCSPDVLERYCALFERGPDVAQRREVRFEGVRMVAAVLPSGMIAFEGEVDEERMGDW